jgi:hypothetical protein
MAETGCRSRLKNMPLPAVTALWGGRGSDPRLTDYQTVGSDSSGYGSSSTAPQQIWLSCISGANRAIPSILGHWR